MGYYIDGNGNYYEGDRQTPEHQEVTDRPSQHHRWEGEWVLDPAKFNAPIMAQIRALEASELLPRLARDLAKKSMREDVAKFYALTTEPQIDSALVTLYETAVALGDAAPEVAKSWKKFKDFDDAIQALKAQRV